MSLGTELNGDGASTAFTINDGETEGYAGTIVNLNLFREALWRRRWFCVCAALVGLLLGASMPFVLPPSYVATADLYLTEPSASGTQGMANDVSLLETRAVAAKVVAELHIDTSAADFLSSFSGQGISGVIMELQLSAPTSKEAVTYANAVAKAFLALRALELREQTAVTTDQIDSQVNALDGDINTLTTSINALSVGPAGSQAANQLTELVNERSNDSGEVDTLQAEVQQDLLSQNSVIEGSDVLDPAVTELVHTKRVAATDAVAGLVGLLGLSIGAVVLAAIISDRPRRRADVAVALGVPVELSLDRFPRFAWFRRWRLRRHLRSQPPNLHRVERRLRAHLDQAGGTALAVVALEASDVTALSVGSLAFSLAGEGKKVAVTDMAEGQPLASLFPAVRKAPKGTRCTVALGADRASIVMVAAPDDPGELVDTKMFNDVDVVLVLATVSPAVGAEYLASWADAAVVVLRAGKVSATRMAACSQLLRQAGLLVRSAILVGAGRQDETAGVAPRTGLATATRKRAMHGRPGGDDVTPVGARGPLLSALGARTGGGVVELGAAGVAEDF